MPNENIYDEVLGDVKDIMLEIRDGIKKQYKNVKPFGVKQLTPQQQLEQYHSSGYEIFKQIAQTEGVDKATDYRDKMERLQEQTARRFTDARPN
ncbi:hypothetical protein LCGC14_2552780 [marine sediment metagenome]|uniref:Uncharacterized protein n=1 Tax=marine sediment metagenome TaxID=412755 RepID=A0A0F9BAC8_9ZZZZ